MNTTRTTHDWTPAQLQFLADHAEDPRADLVKAFRAKFKSASGELTDRAIVNRRYVLTHKGTTEDQVRRAAARRGATNGK